MQAEQSIGEKSEKLEGKQTHLNQITVLGQDQQCKIPFPSCKIWLLKVNRGFAGTFCLGLKDKIANKQFYNLESSFMWGIPYLTIWR